MQTKSLKFFSILTLLSISGCATVMHPSCDDASQWPANMAFVKLKNAGKVDNTKVDFSKTLVERLVSKKTAGTRYSQVHSVTFFLKGGQVLRTFTVSDATVEECSMGDVDVYLNIENINSGTND